MKDLKKPPELIDDLLWYPMLPTKAVVFPFQKITLSLDSLSSQLAVKQALKAKHLILFAAQTDEKIEDPKETEICRIGTIGYITHYAYYPEQIMKISVQTLARAQLNELELTDKGWRASARPIFHQLELVPEDLELAEALRSQTCDALLNKSIRVWNNENSAKLISNRDVLYMPDLIADQLYLDHKIKQELLETYSLTELCQRLMEIVEDESQNTQRSEEKVKAILAKRPEKDYLKNELPLAKNTYQLEDLLIWQHKVDNVKFATVPNQSFRPNPLVIGSLVIISILSPGMIVALNRSTGKEVWKQKLENLAGDSIYYNQKLRNIIFVKTTQTLYALSLKTGKILWKFSPYASRKKDLYASPVVDGNDLFISDRRGRFYCLDITTGNVKWDKQLEVKDINVNATALVYNEIVITASDGHKVFALEKSTGKEVWHHKISGPCSWQLSLWKNGLIVPSDKSVYYLNPKTGELIHRWQWPARDISNIALGKDFLLIETKKFHSRPYLVKRHVENKNVLHLVKINNTLLHKEIPFYTHYLQYNPKNKLVYLASFMGISVLDSSNGEWLFNLTSKNNSLRTGLINIKNNIIYLLEDKGTIYALRHPEY
jgi:outer membrane protein assembly factor BamB/Lon protease-like protein